MWPFISDTITAGETYAYDQMSADEARSVWVAPAPDECVVYEHQGRLLGTAKYGANRAGNGAHIGTASFMVSPEAQGHGVGRELGTYVVERLRVLGFRGIQFNAVVETNEAAINLWESLGFAIVGTVPGAFHSPTYGYVGLHVMYRDL